MYHEDPEALVRDATWYCLWGPMGIKNAVRPLQTHLKSICPTWDIWYPTYRQRKSEYSLYPSYAFIYCRWDKELEDDLTAHSPLFVQFLRPGREVTPLPLIDGEIERVKTIIEQLNSKEITMPNELKEGDQVFFVKKPYDVLAAGTVLAFRSNGKVDVECLIFSRPVVMTVHSRDIQKVNADPHPRVTLDKETP